MAKFFTKFLLLFFSNCLLECICQFVYRTSDRMQTMTATFTSSGTQTVTFPTAFMNTPLITYSILQSYIGIDGTVGFHINTVSVSTTSVTLQVSNNSGNTLHQVQVGILATDYPNQQQFTGSFSGGGSKTFTANANIIGYCAFINGFSGNIAFAYTQFQLTSSISGPSVKMVYTETLWLNMDSVTYNILVFYQSSSLSALLYTFSFTATNEMTLNLGQSPKSFTVATSLTSADTVFYGLQYWDTASNSNYNYLVTSGSPLISGTSVNLVLKIPIGYIPWITVAVFQAMIRYCPTGNYIIYDGSDYQCVSSCASVNSQTYNDSANTFALDYSAYTMNPCTSCNAACYGCTGPATTDCTSCTTGLYLNGITNTCDSSQPDLTYCTTTTIDSQTYQNCQPCYSTCQTCSGGANNQCTSCLPTYPYSYKGQCLAGTIAGVYCDPNSLTCADCTVTNCNTCDSTLQTCSLCLTGFYLYNNICYSSIQPQTFCDSNNICQSCDETKCVNCITTADTCTSCQTNQYLYQNVCYNSNPDGALCTINAQGYYDCVSCSANCKSCTGVNANECTTCFSQIFFYNNSCTVVQPDATYYDSNYLCYPCNSNCKECNGANDTDCTACFDGFYLNTTNGNTCQVCQKGCSLCSGQFNNCSACYGLYYLKGNQCVLDCLSNQYFDQTTRDCTQCNSLCLTCSEKTSSDCLSCISTATLNSSNQCVCNVSNYGFIQDGTQCEQCEVIGCTTCKMSAVCEACTGNSTLRVQSTGLQQCICNQGYYYSTYYNSCTKCHQDNCVICTADGSACSICSLGFVLTGGNCKYCGNNSYADNNTNTCVGTCPELCEVCTNSSACTMYDSNNPEYVPPSLCNYTCSKCSGLTSTDCIDCSSDTRQYNSKTKLCECKPNYKDIGVATCQIVQKVDEQIVSMHQKFNSVGFPIQSASMLLNISPAVTYSYVLMQLIGDLSYVQNNQSIDNILNFYTKYNLNNLYTLNSEKTTTTNSSDQSSLQIGRLLAEGQKDRQLLSEDSEDSEVNTENQQIIHSEIQSSQDIINIPKNRIRRRIMQTNQTDSILSPQSTFLNVQREYRFFYASVIPLGTTVIFFIISMTIHLIEIKLKKIIKFGSIFKWNSLILATQINSNFMIFTMTTIDFKIQEMIDKVSMMAFIVIYIMQLIWIFIKVREKNGLDSSYSIIESYFDRSQFMGRYYFFLVELKKIIFCAVVSITLKQLKFTIWVLLGLQIIEVVFKKWQNPFKNIIDLYATVALDITFSLILAIFGVFLNSSSATQLVTFATMLLILLVIFSLITIALILYRLILIIKNFRNKKDEDKKLDDITLTSRPSLANSLQQEMTAISAHVKWQKNPIHQRLSTNQSN